MIPTTAEEAIMSLVPFHRSCLVDTRLALLEQALGVPRVLLTTSWAKSRWQNMASAVMIRPRRTMPRSSAKAALCGPRSDSPTGPSETRSAGSKISSTLGG
jgi:hypothetical protein